MAKSILQKGKDSQWPKNVGILGMEVYFPDSYVDQSDLERFYEVGKGKYTIGLGQERMAFCTDREDINSICLTVTQSLLEKHSIAPKDVGFLMVGTETLIDKSKSIKTVLMDLFAESGNTDIEGLHTTNACYGGTSALFHALNWIESSYYDNRYAIVVAADIAVYESSPTRVSGGCAAVAMLLGPNAAIVFDRKLRSTYMTNVYDFYKPDMVREYPSFDGQLSIKCYLQALDNCFESYCKKANKLNGSLEFPRFDAILFHVPYSKLVQKSLARLHLLDYLKNPDFYKHPNFKQLDKYRNVKLETTYEDRDLEKIVMSLSQDVFEVKTKPALFLPKNLGNSYTASLYTSLISYLLSKPIERLANKRILLYSYGSGLAASMFSARLSEEISPKSALAKLIDGLADVQDRLNRRHKFSPESFQTVQNIRELAYNKAPYKPQSQLDNIQPGTYYLVEVDEKFHRTYKRFSKDENSNANIK